MVLYICLCGFPPFSDELYSRDNPYTLAQQIKMGRFDYPSPYWDSIGDPALDLIDRMLTVDVAKRLTVDECLEHPWTRNAGTINPADSTDGLTGAMHALDFSRRKVQRERTLLSDINDIKVNKVVPVDSQQMPGKDGGDTARVKVWQKNPNGKIVRTPKNKSKGTGTATAKKEEDPAANRQQDEFMGMGGKGDMQLFGDDISSRYLPEEVPDTQKSQK